MAETGSEIIPPIFYSKKNLFSCLEIIPPEIVPTCFFASNKIIPDSCGNYPTHFLRAQIVFLTKHDRTGSYPILLVGATRIPCQHSQYSGVSRSAASANTRAICVHADPARLVHLITFTDCTAREVIQVN